MLQKRIEILSFGKTPEQIAEITRRESFIHLGPSRYTISEAQRQGRLYSRYNTPQVVNQGLNIGYQLPAQLPALPVEFGKYNAIYQYAVKKANQPYSNYITIDMKNNKYSTLPQDEITDANVKAVINNGIYMIVVRDNSFEAKSIIDTLTTLDAEFLRKIDITAIPNAPVVQNQTMESSIEKLRVENPDLLKGGTDSDLVFKPATFSDYEDMANKGLLKINIFSKVSNEINKKLAILEKYFRVPFNITSRTIPLYSARQPELAFVTGENVPKNRKVSDLEKAASDNVELLFAYFYESFMWDEKNPYEDKIGKLLTVYIEGKKYTDIYNRLVQLDPYSGIGEFKTITDPTEVAKIYYSIDKLINKLNLVIGEMINKENYSGNSYISNAAHLFDDKKAKKFNEEVINLGN